MTITLDASSSCVGFAGRLMPLTTEDNHPYRSSLIHMESMSSLRIPRSPYCNPNGENTKQGRCRRMLDHLRSVRFDESNRTKVLCPHKHDPSILPTGPASVGRPGRSHVVPSGTISLQFDAVREISELFATISCGRERRRT